jgi:exopolysaccharide biosynthesis WecB/TagA/CpsF family protein
VLIMPAETPHIAHVTILGVPIAKLTVMNAMDAIRNLLDRSKPAATIAFVNAHTLNLAAKDSSYRAIINRSALVLNDGAGVALAARLQGDRFPINLNGTDFLPLLLEGLADRDESVYFLGAQPGVADRAAANLLRRIPRLRIVGLRHGYFREADSQSIAADIHATGASVLLVALGNPAQERWLAAFLESTGVQLGIGVGAFFDFMAGDASRAPRWMRAAGLEWLYRLGREPRRLGSRYILGNPAFMLRVVADRFGLAAHAQQDARVDR